MSTPSYVEEVCNPHFSVYQLNESSHVTEMFLSNQCIPNVAKLAIFSFFIIVYTIVFAVSTVLLVLDFLNKETGSSLRKKSYMTVWLGSLASLCIHITFMNGVTDKAKFVLFTIPYVCQQTYMTLIMDAWFEASRQLKYDEYNKYRFRFRTWLVVMNIILTVNLIIFFTAAMIYHDTNLVVFDRFYAAWTTIMCVTFLTGDIIMITTGNILIRICQRTYDDQKNVRNVQNERKLVDTSKIDAFCQNLHKTNKVCITAICIDVVMAVITPSLLSIGLYYLFYIQYTFFELILVLSYSDILRTVYKRQDNSGTTQPNSNSENGSGPVLKSAYSFTVEDLSQKQSV